MKPAAVMLAIIATLAAPAIAADNPAPYAGQQTRPIKSLSDEDIAALRKGEGMGMAAGAARQAGCRAVQQ